MGMVAPAELPGEPPRFLGVAGVGEVAAEREHVGPLRDVPSNECPERRTVTCPAEVEVGHRRDPNRAVRTWP